MSVIFHARYLLLLAFAKVKPFSFIKSIDVWSTKCRQIINRYGANVSPCITYMTMSKKSVSSSSEQTFTFVFLYSIILAVMVSLGPGGNISQSSSCMDIYHPSQKPSKLDKQEMWDTAVKVRTNSSVMYSCGPPHMDEQGYGNQLEPIYNSSVLSCSMEDLLRVMDDRDEWQESVREIHASSTPWWWWYTYAYIYMIK